MSGSTDHAVVRGDCRDLIYQLEPESVALSFWSPPYFVGKDYERDETYESWIDLLREVLLGHNHAMKPGGFVVVNIADIYCFADEAMPKIQAMNMAKHKSKVTKEMVLEAKRAHPAANRDMLASILGCSEQTIDRRLNGNNIRGGKHAVQTRLKVVGGLIEEFGLEAGLYMYDHRIWLKDPAWANSRWTTNTLKAVSEYEHLYIMWKPGEYAVNREKLTSSEWKEWGLRGVWRIPSVRANVQHEAMFPLELARRVIRLYSESGDLVLDPFLGSGTTSIAAILEKRRSVGFEKEAEYVRLAHAQIENTLNQPVLAFS
jgi:DNA modification methylase